MTGKTLLCSIAMSGLIFLGMPGVGLAQDSSAPKATTQPQPAPDAKPKPPEKGVESYHLDFAVIELEDGKKINTRQYSTYLNTNDSSEIKIGTRIPVEEKEGQIQYLDVGTDISARITENRGQSELTVRAELSSFALPEQADKQNAHPVLRQLRIGGVTMLPLGKPIIIGSVDDPTSKREFQLQVTVTKL